jgi:hypothetical protein
MMELNSQAEIPFSTSQTDRNVNIRNSWAIVMNIALGNQSGLDI